jgi:hypothetical protein
MEIDAERRWVSITLTGDLTIADLVAFMGRMQEHPDYSDDLCGLIDCREMTSVLDIKEVRSLADLENKRPGPPWRSRRAVLVGSGEHYSLGRMFMMFAESSPVQYDIFYNLEAAMEWLKG